VHGHEFYLEYSSSDDGISNQKYHLKGKVPGFTNLANFNVQMTLYKKKKN